MKQQQVKINLVVVVTAVAEVKYYICFKADTLSFKILIFHIYTFKNQTIWKLKNKSSKKICFTFGPFLRSLPGGHRSSKCQDSFVQMSLCHVTFSKPLIGHMRECYIVEEVIEVDELDEDNLKSAAAGKQHK